MLDTNKIHQGHTLELLKQLDSDSIDCIITSPPYYGLRAYPNSETIWDGYASGVIKDGKELQCVHKFNISAHHTPGQSDKNTTLSPIDGLEKSWEEGFCTRCRAWKGQLGLEPDYKMYLNHMLQITAELRRVLKPSGTLWWNMGDTYSSNSSYSSKGRQGYEEKKEC